MAALDVRVAGLLLDLMQFHSSFDLRYELPKSHALGQFHFGLHVAIDCVFVGRWVLRAEEFGENTLYWILLPFDIRHFLAQALH